MYLWNIRALAEDLKTGNVSLQDKVLYLTVVWFLSPISIGLSVNDIIDNEIIRILGFLLPALIWYIGIKQCYLANCLGDSKDFTDRIICLSLPLCCRAYVLYLISLTILFPLYQVTIRASFPEIPAQTFWDVIELFVRSIILLIFFWWLRSYMLYVSGVNQHKDTINPPVS